MNGLPTFLFSFHVLALIFGDSTDGRLCGLSHVGNVASETKIMIVLIAYSPLVGDLIAHSLLLSMALMLASVFILAVWFADTVQFRLADRSLIDHTRLTTRFLGETHTLAHHETPFKRSGTTRLSEAISNRGQQS